MKLLYLSILLTSLLFSTTKTPSDVYSEAIVLKDMVKVLRNENGVVEAFDKIDAQKDKVPRNVLQKSIEVLRKVNKYREIHSMGEISVPPVPPRDIMPQDVYKNVERLKQEVFYLLHGKKSSYKKQFIYKQYYNKSSSDVYRELWIISMGFDKLLGQGFTPTDVYTQTQQVVEAISFLRLSQREKNKVDMPPLRENQHPNHALYKSVELIKQINIIEKKLWMHAVPVPKVEEKVISPTEVYDSLQTAIAELNRISRRLGVEHSFEFKAAEGKKSPADVVQNLEYAIALLPSFSFNKTLNQYPKIALLKTPNDVFGLSEHILRKLEYIKVQKGIKIRARETTYIYELKPIHVYEKGIENLEKLAKLKENEGIRASQVPNPTTENITPSEVYELILRLDDELGIMYKNVFLDNIALHSYRAISGKKQYNKKTSSDVYDNLWKISYELDTILNEEYTPNETYVLAKNIESDLLLMQKYFLGKNLSVKHKKYKVKRPSDVFAKSLQILKKLELIKRRGNFKSAKIILSQDEIVTPTSVYNALRIISATISEIDVFYAIPRVQEVSVLTTSKTPTDVYEVVENIEYMLSSIIKESNYEN